MSVSRSKRSGVSMERKTRERTASSVSQATDHNPRAGVVGARSKLCSQTPIGAGLQCPGRCRFARNPRSSFRCELRRTPCLHRRPPTPLLRERRGFSRELSAKRNFETWARAPAFAQSPRSTLFPYFPRSRENFDPFRSRPYLLANRESESCVGILLSWSMVSVSQPRTAARTERARFTTSTRRFKYPTIARRRPTVKLLHRTQIWR